MCPVEKHIPTGAQPLCGTYAGHQLYIKLLTYRLIIFLGLRFDQQHGHINEIMSFVKTEFNWSVRNIYFDETANIVQKILTNVMASLSGATLLILVKSIHIFFQRKGPNTLKNKT